MEEMLKHGLPTTILLFLGVFFWQGVWPFLKGQIERAQQELSALNKEYFEALRRRDLEFQKFADSFQLLNNKIDIISDDIGTIVGKK
jgi:hypothetical protein